MLFIQFRLFGVSLILQKGNIQIERNEAEFNEFPRDKAACDKL